MAGVLADKAILITGASTGIGRATALRAAEEGAPLAGRLGVERLGWPLQSGVAIVAGGVPSRMIAVQMSAEYEIHV